MHPDHTPSIQVLGRLRFCRQLETQGCTLRPNDSEILCQWVISYAGCPISWASKTITALSMTEAKYVALSMSLHDIIPMMRLLKEARAFGVHVGDTPQGYYVRCSRITVAH